MSVQMSEEEIYREARKRVEEKKGFFIHLILYIIVNIMLVLIWAFPGGGGFPWFVFPLGGWGIGILFHFLGTFVFSRQTDWERKAIEKEAERLRKGGR
jgi:cytochrome b561